MEPVCNERNECGECCEREECCECGCNERREPVTMDARVLRASCCELLVCDLCGCQEVLVHADNACRFQVGQCVRITYSGAMTRSIPPQISADCVALLNNCGGCRC